MKRPEKITCPKCGGSGQVPLTEELSSVLKLVRRKREMTAVEAAATLDPNGDFHSTAFNNRLEQLRSAGFVTRRRVHKAWVYSVK